MKYKEGKEKRGFLLSKLKKENKRGQLIMNSLFFFIILFVFAFLAIVGWKAWNSFYTEFNTTQHYADMPEEATDFWSGEIHGQYPTVIDNAFLIVLIGLWVFLLMSSFHMDTHPAFFGLAIIMLVIVLIVVAIFGNMFDDITSDPELDFPNEFPIINFIMENFLVVAVFIVISIMIAMYGNYRSGY